MPPKLRKQKKKDNKTTKKLDKLIRSHKHLGRHVQSI